jgi:nucleotide-binding universal stress UspA family protein
MNRNRLLIPLDASKFSQQIIPTILHFFPADESELILFRVGKPPEKLAMAESEMDLSYRYATPENITGFGLTTLRLHPPTPDEPVIRGGSPENEVTEIQAQEGVKDALADELHDDVLWPLRNAGYEVRLEVRFGTDPAEEIVEYVTQEPIDLIAMATHGRSGLSKLLHGSVAETVLKNVSIPVLLLPLPEDSEE